MKIGYIQKSVVNGRNNFKFREATYSRKITSKSDKIYSKMLAFPAEYEDVEFTTEQMRQPNIIIVQEPFFLDEELRKKATDWVEWANNTEPKNYDPFAGTEEISNDD